MGSVARFNGPFGMAVDSAGNVYVADSDNHTIRKVTPAGAATTLAGLAANPGSTDGAGNTARFDTPSGVTRDSVGNLYVADTGNDTIRKITPAGVVSTFAGLAGSAGSDDGTSSSARFNLPSGVIVDGAGNLYVADTGNDTIRKITPAGVVTTLAGLAGSAGSDDGKGSAARFRNPTSVTVDDDRGNVYVADSGNQTIRKITATADVSTLAGLAGNIGTDDGIGSSARFDLPSGVTIDTTGNIYVADSQNNTIRKVTSSGLVSTLAGDANEDQDGGGNTDGTGSAARFNLPRGIAADTAGNLYVGDTHNDTFRKVTAAGVVTTLAGLAAIGTDDGLSRAARFYEPNGVVVTNAGMIYISDTYNHTLRSISSDGVVTTLAGQPGEEGTADGMGETAQFDYPRGLAVDSKGNIYVGDRYNDTIRKVTPAGLVSTLAGMAGVPGSADGIGNEARFNEPYGVAVDPAGDVYVVDSVNDTIRKITPAASVTTLAGLAGNSGSTDGTGDVARFDAPSAIAIDSAGNLYVADTDNATIRKITPDGVVSTLAGLPHSFGSTDGPGSAARFFRPTGIAVDGMGNIYVSDSNNQTIRKVTSGGTVTTLAGSVGLVGSVDGVGQAALFHVPRALTATSSGTLFVADNINDVIRVGLPAGQFDNISTRGEVGTDANVLIAGFIIIGGQPTSVIIRALGPSLPLDGALADPVVELHDSAGQILATNDNWQDSPDRQAIIDSTIPPANDNESAILMTLSAGSYTAVVRGVNNGTGIGLVEVYNLDSALGSRLANISTRGDIGTGANVMIGGFILDQSTAVNVLVRAIGPELSSRGVTGALQDTTLELHDSNGLLLAANDDWESDQKQQIIDTTVPPTDPRESAIVSTLAPGPYTAIVAGQDEATGVALVEVYVLP
jgi:streptogramin lyase